MLRSRGRWVGGIAASFLFVAVGLLGCSGDDDGASAEATDEPDEVVEQEPSADSTAPPAPVDVEIVEETFVDDSRPTSASAFAPGAETRTLRTIVAYPTPLDGRLPLVVLAHGMWGDPAKFGQLIDAWARAGYVVAAPTFPRSTEAQPGGRDAADVSDVVNQPADVTFVIDQMLALDDDPDSPLRGHVDTEHIGLAGHSLGAVTTYGTVYNSCCQDERIDAAMLLAIAPPSLLGGIPGQAFAPSDVPALMMVADGDFVYASSGEVYPTLTGPKWLVTMHGGDPTRHASPFEDTPDPADDLVRAVTVAYWDLQLKADADAEQRLEVAAQPTDGSATLDHAP